MIITDFSELLVLDSKFTTWENSESKPANQVNQTIKISIAHLDTAKAQIKEQEEIFILPSKSKVSKYCEEKTGISQAYLEKHGVPFEKAWRKLRIHYMSKDRLTAAYGASHRKILERDCKIAKLENLFSHPHYDIEDLYHLMVGSNSYIELSEAVRNCGLKWNVSNQAANVANLFLKMSKPMFGEVAKVKNLTDSIIRSLN